MAKIKTETIIHMYLYPNRLIEKILLNRCFHLESKANFNDVWLRSVSSFLNLFLTSLLGGLMKLQDNLG